MRALSPLLLLLTMAVLAHAESYLFTLQQKVVACNAVLRVSVTEARMVEGSRDVAVCKAKVVEVLKGTPRQEVTFRFHAYGDFSPEKLPKVVKKDYILFLHELGPPHKTTNEFWVFEGPEGIRPIAPDYQEYKISADKKFATETLSHSNFVAAIRTFAAQPSVKKE